MSDVTVQYYLDCLKKNHPSNWRFRYFKTKLEELISQYRITARKFRGSYIAQYSNFEANKIERLLLLATERKNNAKASS